MKKTEAKKRVRSVLIILAILNFMARAGHFEEVIFAQTLERGERASHVPIW